MAVSAMMRFALVRFCLAIMNRRAFENYAPHPRHCTHGEIPEYRRFDFTDRYQRAHMLSASERDMRFRLSLFSARADEAAMRYYDMETGGRGRVLTAR